MEFLDFTLAIELISDKIKDLEYKINDICVTRPLYKKADLEYSMMGTRLDKLTQQKVMLESNLNFMTKYMEALEVTEGF